MIPGSANALLLASAGAGGYRSVRLNASDSAYLSRTPASAGNRKTWTWAGWVKRSAISSAAIQTIFGVYDSGGSNYHNLNFSPADKFVIYDTNGVTTFVTTQVFRDPSAWFHIVVARDTTQATASNRVKLYINGTQVTTFDSTSYPAQNSDGEINSTAQHNIGSSLPFDGRYFSGYLADIHFIDGQALDPTSFGEFDDNGIWQPIRYTGSYGTNGFHLDFSDNSSAAALGYDAAGSNDWTVNNLSVTAGAGNDSLVDVPTNGSETDTGVGGEVRGNYCTWNPLDILSTTLANGNLQAAGSTSLAGVTGTIGVASDKYYWEITAGSPKDMVGVWSANTRITSFPGGTSDSYGYYADDGQKYNAGSGAAYGATFTTGDIIGVALDMDAGTLTFYKNGVSQGVAYSSLVGTFRPAVRAGNPTTASTATYLNAGQRPFAYQAPSGYKSLCTANLPDPVVAKPSEVMDVKLYTGNGTTQTISGLGFSPDLVWIKGRSSAQFNSLYDTIRGVNNRLFSNNTDAENTATTMTAFNADGFAVSTDGGAYTATNANSTTYVAWTWDAGSSTVTNTQGSITSQVRANPSAGFSVVTYTGNGTGGATIGHGLGVKPSLIIVKSRSTSASWLVQHISTGGNVYLLLNTTSAITGDIAAWNNTNPTSSVFTVGTGSGVNGNSVNYVAYCFAPVEGYSAFGSYTGNGSADGPMVFTNMRPRWIMLKRTDSTSNWTIIDTAREGYNVDNDPLYPNLSDAEGTTDLADILSNGFKLRSTDASVNANTGTYVYACFAESPFALARAR